MPCTQTHETNYNQHYVTVNNRPRCCTDAQSKLQPTLCNTETHEDNKLYIV